MWVPLALSASALGYAAYAAAWPNAQRWGACISQLDGEADEIALTFDDGPSNETPRFLDALDALGVKASFFVCGENVERRPGIARAIVEAGHAIGNHSFSHPMLPVCSATRVREELRRTQDAIEDATGRRTAVFRPPYGLRSPALNRAFAETGLTGVHWTVIGFDWKWNAARIARRVLAHASGRAIVCLHDGHATRPIADRSETLQAVQTIVPKLRDCGYRFVPLPSWEASG